MKSWLGKSDIEMYSTHNKGKSLIGKRIVRALIDKIDDFIFKKYLYW